MFNSDPKNYPNVVFTDGSFVQPDWCCESRRGPAAVAARSRHQWVPRWSRLRPGARIQSGTISFAPLIPEIDAHQGEPPWLFEGEWEKQEICRRLIWVRIPQFCNKGIQSPRLLSYFLISCVIAGWLNNWNIIQTSAMSSLKLGPVLAKAFLELVRHTCHLTRSKNMI